METEPSANDEIVICGACGAPMIKREVAPCLDCGGDPQEVEELRSGYHRYARFDLFDGDILCDFCDADMPSTDPLYWGFPNGFSWDAAFQHEDFMRFSCPPQGRYELACSKCHNTLRKQEFVKRNAERNGIVVPKDYWPYL